MSTGDRLAAGPDRGSIARDQRRARTLLLATGIILCVLGLGWSLYFALQGAGRIVAMESVLVLLGAIVIATTRMGRVRAASWIAFGGLFVYLCLFTVLLDAQAPGIPRSTHLFLLVLAASAHYVFRTEPTWLRYGCVCLFLVAFVVFAALPGTAMPEHAIPDDMRRSAIWFNVAMVAISLLIVLWLAESDGMAHRSLHRALRDALSGRHFVLHYQPQLDTHGRIIGAEALLRWQDPAKGMVAPGEFIQAAEETGFILPLGQWVLSTACEQLAAWQRLPEFASLRLSVNVSVLQLQQPDFVPQLLGILQHHGTDPSKLTLELTESVLMHDIAEAAGKLRTISDTGVRLSLDDFGTGYSSLSYLGRMPLDELKIDRAFTAAIDDNPDAATIIRNLLQLGHDLGMDVIAEGIERPEQHAFLIRQGCRMFQGYLLGKPMDIDAFQQRVVAQA